MFEDWVKGMVFFYCVKAAFMFIILWYQGGCAFRAYILFWLEKSFQKGVTDEKVFDGIRPGDDQFPLYFI